MNLFQRLLWIWRAVNGVTEVERLALQHPDDPLYRIYTPQSALSIFLEASSQAKRIEHTTEKKGEIIECIFLSAWQQKHPWCVDAAIPVRD
jgi:hypothetical protein